MAVVTVLRQEENVRLDPDRLTELYVKLGESGAEEVVCRAMEELAVQLTEIQAVNENGVPGNMQVNARNIAELASDVGLLSLARVAFDVDYCLHFDDQGAISATLARLSRVGDRSLMAVWDLRDLSM